MRAFWWYEKGLVAGMARPGFNNCRWFEMPFEEAIVMGWLGQHSLSPIAINGFWEHVNIYSPKIRPFYKTTDEEFKKIIADLHETDFFNHILSRICERTGLFKKAFLENDLVHFELNLLRLNDEIHFLKSNNIQHIITLTEHHHAKDVLDSHFTTHHFSIEDLGAPTLEQAEEFSKLLQYTKSKNETTAVHCLAGIGRTSTMIMAADLFFGHNLDTVLEKIAKQNTAFTFAGAQAEFIHQLAERYKKN